MRTVILALLIAAFSSSSHAMSLVTRSQQLTSTLIPKDLWVVSFDLSQSSPIDRQYDANSTVVSFDQHLSRDLTAQEIIENISDPADAFLAAAAFEANNIQPETLAGTIQNNLDIKYTSQTFILGYGVNDNLNFFFIAPRLKIEIGLATQLQYAQSMKNLIADLRAQGQTERAQEIESRENTVLSEQLSKYDYEPSYISKFDGIPNFVLMARYAPSWMKQNRISLDSSVIVPNKHDNYVDQFIPLQLFEDSVSFVQTFNASHSVFERIEANYTAGYQLRTQHRKNMRVPESADSVFSNDKKQVQVKYGDEWMVGAQVSRPTKLLTPFSSISYRQKFSDTYSATNVSSERFKSLIDESEQNLTSLTVGLSISTVDAFLRGRFLIPTQLTLMYSDSLSGKNSFKSQVYTANLMVFYQ